MDFDAIALLKCRVGKRTGRNYLRIMPDWPTEIITDQDPRYLELLEQESEARVRFYGSDLARTEMAAFVDPNRERPDWRPVPVQKRTRQRVFRWD